MVLVIAWWALACRQEWREPEAASRLAPSHRAVPIPATLHTQNVAHPTTLLQTNTNYSQEKHRCEYLHSKLAHIKRLIAEYDQRQLQAWP